MDKKQITDIIKAHQHMPYSKVKSQAEEAGLSSEQFEESWREAKMDKSVDNDKRVLEIKKEIKSNKGLSTILSELKIYFKEKGYLDDEVDLAYALKDAKIKYLPFSSWIVGLAVVALVIVVFFFLLQDQYRDLGEIIGNGIHVIVAVVVVYFAFLISQFRGYVGKIIQNDFHAIKTPGRKQLFSNWKKLGSSLLRYPSATITNLFEMEYDGRQTYYGEYQYTTGSGKNRTTHHYSFIAQKAHKELPLVHCFRPWMDRSFLRKEVQLEGVDFNKKYNIYADKPTDAFYVFNPRVMHAMLEEEIVKDMKSFETVGDFIIMSFTALPLHTGVRLKPPIVRFKDYQNVKTKMLHRLDLASDINDTLSRQIVDSGEKRSVAKLK